VSGYAISGGHFFPEQSSAEMIAALRAFFGRSSHGD
jgi:surfactin synthase thioesterase subunit